MKKGEIIEDVYYTMEKGQFEVESESKSAAGNEASDTADDAEEVKHTLTFVIYE